MTKAVVDLLETVVVNEHQSGLKTIRSALLDDFGQVLIKVGSVGQSGKRILAARHAQGIVRSSKFGMVSFDHGLLKLQFLQQRVEVIAQPVDLEHRCGLGTQLERMRLAHIAR